MTKSALTQIIEVDNVEDLRQNILAFRKGWRSEPHLMERLGLFKQGRYWLLDEESGGFANAKFAGYKGMTARKYTQGRDSHLHGNVNIRIARILEQRWSHNRNLVAQLSAFAVEMAGPEAVARVDISKWRFLVLPSASLATSRTPKTSGKGGKRTLVLLPGDPDKDCQLVGEEGAKRMVSHICTERDTGLAAAVKRRWLKNDPLLACVVCGFSFVATYGELGRGFIEAHHRELLSSRGRRGTSTEEDFEPVCSNCHRMLHRMGIDAMDTGRLMAIVKRGCGE